MNRTILTVAGVFSASSLLLVDSAVKGTALLALAAIAALMLRRDSAATRHLVWLLAMVTLRPKFGQRMTLDRRAGKERTMREFRPESAAPPLVS